MYSMNPFLSTSPSSMNISESSNPTDQEIIGMLKFVLFLLSVRGVTKLISFYFSCRGYLAHQDLVRLLFLASSYLRF